MATQENGKALVGQTKQSAKLRFFIIGIVSLLFGGVIYVYVIKPTYYPIIEIAVVCPKTGEDSLSGKELSFGAYLADLKIGKDGRLVRDYNIRIREYDDESTEDGARRVALSIASNPHVAAVVGHFTSGNTLAALPIYRIANLPVIMPIATLTSITKNKGFLNAFRMPPSNEIQGQTIVAFAREYLKAKSFFIIRDNTPYAEDLEFSAKEALKAHGLVDLGTDIVPRGTQYFKNLSDIISMHDPAADAIIYFGYSPEAIYLATQLKSRSGTKIKLLGSDGLYGKRYLGKQEAESTYVAYQVAPMEKLRERPLWKEYCALFEKEQSLLQGDQGNSVPEGWTSWAFDAVLMAREAISKSLENSKVPRSEVVLDIFQRNNQSGPFDFSGALSDYRFVRGKNENTLGSFFLYEVIGHKYSLVNWVFGENRSLIKK